MSYRLEYRYSAIRIPGALVSDGVDRFAICVEGGDNNSYESSGGNARRSRSWGVDFLGTKEEILEKSCIYASACESGSLKPMGKDCTAEAYIGRIRKLIDKAKSVEMYNWQTDARISLHYNCEIGGVEDLLLSNLSVERIVERPYLAKTEMACFKFQKQGANDFRTFFDVYPAIRHELAAWKFAECYGPN